MFKDFQNCSTKCEQFKKVINPGLFFFNEQRVLVSLMGLFLLDSPPVFGGESLPTPTWQIDSLVARS